MFLLLSILLPIIAAVTVYNLYQNDLYRAKGTRKLKRGALESLVKRHQHLLYAHLAIFIAAIFLSFYVLGGYAVIMVIAWGIVFIGHINAFSNFSRELIAALSNEDIDSSRLTQDRLDDRAAMIDEVEEKDIAHS